MPPSAEGGDGGDGGDGSGGGDELPGPDGGSDGDDARGDATRNSPVYTDDSKLLPKPNMLFPAPSTSPRCSGKSLDNKGIAARSSACAPHRIVKKSDVQPYLHLMCADMRLTCWAVP